MGVRIFWAVATAFLVGVAYGTFMPAGIAFAICVACIAGGISVATQCDVPIKPAIVAASALCAFALGILRIDAVSPSFDPSVSSRVGTSVDFQGLVSAEPDRRDTQTRVVVDLTDVSKEGIRALAVLPAHADVHYGDLIQIRGVLRVPEPFDTGNGRSFDYRGYLAKDGIAYELENAHSQIVSPARDQLRIFRTPNVIVARVIDIKQAYIRGLARVLSEPEAGLAGGITIGDKRSVGPELTAAFQRDALMHMIVLSGYNITVVLNAVERITSFARGGFSFGCGILTIIFFIIVSGGAASAVRAGAMALVAVYARSSARVYKAERALAATAVAMVAWNPLILAYDPSFQLSALATFGLVMFSPIVSARLQWLTEKWGMREIAAATIATQAVVLPLLLYQNGTFSIVALPANILALAPVPFAMLFSLVAGVAGMLGGALSFLFAVPAYILLAYIVGIARLFAALPFAAVSVAAFPFWLVSVAYIFVYIAFLLLRASRHKNEDQ